MKCRQHFKTMQSGKAPGPDDIHPEFILHLRNSTTNWLRLFLTACLTFQAIPNIWRKAKAIGILKQNKPAEQPKSYRPISLLCIPFNLMERLILNRIKHTVEAYIPHEHAVFREGRSTTDQVTLLTEDIEAGFQRKEKCGVVLFDLSAAYGTVWHRGLKLKLLKVIPDKSLVNFIMNMISSRSFVLYPSEEKSKRRFLKNGVPQGSVLAPLLFNIYTADLPHTRSKKYIYADDIALMISDKSIVPIEHSLSEDLDTMSSYFDNWRLKLNLGKTVCSSFHLAHRLADYQLKVRCNGNIVPCESHQTYLGITLDRTLTYKNHLDRLSQKVSARNNLLRRLSGQTWGASLNILQTSAVRLVYAPAEYCAPTWSHSTHTKKIDIALNSTMRIVSGCLRSTPVDYLPVVSGIVPPDIRRSSHTLKICAKAKANQTHLLHEITRNSDINPNLLLNTRKSFHPQCTQLHNTPTADTPTSGQRLHGTLDGKANSTRLQKYISTPNKHPPGHDLNRHCWVRLNRLRTGHGRFGHMMQKMGLREDAACSCGEAKQTAEHVINFCPDTTCYGDCLALDKAATDWLHKLKIDV